MKNQYFGDINDFRKYGLLRTVRRVSGLALGVCWCLTNDDGSSQGELRKYLKQSGRWRDYDAELYDQLQRLDRPDVTRSVALAREWDLIPGTLFFEALLSDHRSARSAYFQRAHVALSDCDLVFFDPDIGIEVPSTRLGASGSSQYVYWSELKAFYASGKSLLIYQHFPRVVRERFVPFVGGRLREELTGSSVVAFSTAHVVFFLVSRSEHVHALEQAARTVQQRWSGQIDLRDGLEALMVPQDSGPVGGSACAGVSISDRPFSTVAAESRGDARSAVRASTSEGRRHAVGNSRCRHGIDHRFCSVCRSERPTAGAEGISAGGGATLSEILRFLDSARIRATYGAVADVLGVIPRQVGALLGPRRPAASWVVNAKDWCPTDYQPGEMHPDLFHTSEVITTGTELRRRLLAWRGQQL